MPNTKPLLNIAIAKLVGIVKEDFYKDLIELVKNDSNFRDALLEIEKLVNWRNAYTTKTFDEEFLFSLSDFELDALIRSFTLLDGAIDKFNFGTDTPVPCLFNRLSDLSYSNFYELADWVLQNRTNKYALPFTWDSERDVKSLAEYEMIDELQRQKGIREREQNHQRYLEKKLANPNKSTNDLIDAIKRKDSASFNKLIRKGADLNARYEDGKTLAEKLKELKFYVK